MRRSNKKQCDHVWKLRLTNMSVTENEYCWWRKPRRYNGTELLYICMKCADLYTVYKTIPLKNEDFAGTPIGEMIERYHEASTTDNHDNSSDSDENE